MIVIIGGGVTGLSTAFWLAREGDARARCSTRASSAGRPRAATAAAAPITFSPLFREEQRLWPLMDELLGYPTEFRPNRIRVALDEGQLDPSGRAGAARRPGLRGRGARRRRRCATLVPLGGPQAVGGFFWHFGGHANPQRTLQAYAWALQDMAAASCSIRPSRASHRGGRRWRSRPAPGRSAATRWCSRPGRRPRGWRALRAAHPDGAGAGRDDRHRAAAADRAWRRGRQRPLRAADPARQPRLWRRPARMAGHRGRCDAARGEHPGDAPASRGGWPSCSRPRPMRASSAAGPASSRTRPDGRPVIDRLAAPDNVVVATLSSVGFGLSPATGRAIAQLVTQGPAPSPTCRS